MTQRSEPNRALAFHGHPPDAFCNICEPEQPSAASEPGSALYRHDPFGITFTGSSDWHCKCGAFGNHSWPGYAHHLYDVRAEADRELLRYREVLSDLWDEAILIPDQVRPAHLTECLQDADALFSDPSAAKDAEARIVEPWKKALQHIAFFMNHEPEYHEEPTAPDCAVCEANRRLRALLSDAKPDDSEGV